MTESADVYIVGLGTSAGGLEALERFFTGMPIHPKLAFLVVQHLSPDYKSHMVELLAKHTPLTVCEAADGAQIEPGSVYLLPPRKNMTIFKGRIYLVEYERGHGLNLPIDIMLESLAKDQGSKAVACILSGTGSDGTRGIRAIKEHGGIVLAQNDTAKFDGMPRSAVSTQLVDFVASAEEMPGIIIRYVTHPHPINQDMLQSKHISEQDLIGKILAILRDRVGVDFTGYKPNTLIRRIERRMSLYEMDELEHYIRFLQQSDTERRTLFKEFLIGVTSFFRDQEAFE
ncbi:MAG TPA: chemotaxis protein CheB, partial [Aggregatilineales bacterium]|nr:chemotaxis protein CheB [Aggregatilineales bacterium]